VGSAAPEQLDARFGASVAAEAQEPALSVEPVFGVAQMQPVSASLAGALTVVGRQGSISLSAAEEFFRAAAFRVVASEPGTPVSSE
jgi:hypothetical protein